MVYANHFLFIFLCMFIANIYCMEKDTKKIVLCQDAARIIEAKYLGETPKEPLCTTIKERFLWTTPHYISSINWNSSQIDRESEVQEPQCIISRDNDHIILTGPRNKKRLLSLWVPNFSHYFIRPQKNHFNFDGPNEEQVILINKSSSGNIDHNNSYYLIQFKTQHDSLLDSFDGSKSLNKSPTFVLNGCQTQGMALASKKLFAITSSLLSNYISWYQYDQNLQTKLLEHTKAQDSLRKIAFLINSTLLGLTKDGTLILYWLNKKNQMKSAKQNLPFKVIDFAVDPVQKGLVALAIPSQNDNKNLIKNTSLAIADIFNRNGSGHIVFQRIHDHHHNPLNTLINRFSLYNNTISYAYGNAYSSHLLKIHPRTRFKLSTTSASPSN